MWMVCAGMRRTLPALRTSPSSTRTPLPPRTCACVARCVQPPHPYCTVPPPNSFCKGRMTLALPPKSVGPVARSLCARCKSCVVRWGVCTPRGPTCLPTSWRPTPSACRPTGAPPDLPPQPLLGPHRHQRVQWTPVRCRSFDRSPTTPLVSPSLCKDKHACVLVAASISCNAR